ncbi:MAG TPA: glycoside hydrolase family 2 TIM barrel-domain containing protein, partial [Xanthomonadales bacterium]|nr:glycoside hydrolase family 2 TIM barrel-domain containing protein [Xanthomonadales bacterium]
MKRIFKLGLLLAVLMILAACDDKVSPYSGHENVANSSETTTAAMTPIKVEIIRVNGGYQLLRDGQPYEIKGAGIDRPKGVDPDGADLAKFAAHGGNSFRNWRDQVETDGLAILEDAQKHGLTVAMSIPVGRERKGFDYDDEEAVARQLEYARGEVLAYRDHPALLVWIIGNEINMHATNFKVFDAVNDIAKMIKELDPNHPVTTTWAGYGADVPELLDTRMPDLDFISVQLYADVVNLPRKLAQTGLSWPVMVTEWGTMGHWEVDKTAWGAPIEMNSSEKARHYETAYRDAIAAVPEQIIGNYAFVWGQKQERTPTWYGLFLEDGSETESIDALHYIWRGEWPENRAPRIESMTLN